MIVRAKEGAGYHFLEDALSTFSTSAYSKDYRGLWKWYPLGLISQDWGFESLTRYQLTLADIVSPRPRKWAFFYFLTSLKKFLDKIS